MPRSTTLKIPKAAPALSRRAEAVLDEQVTESNVDYRVVQIPIDLIDPSPDEVNSRDANSAAYARDSESLKELAASIAQNGVIQAVSLLRRDGRYQIIFGNRRYYAAKLARQQALPARVYDDLTELDQAILNGVENVEREDLTGRERMNWICKLEALNAGVQEISRRTGKSPGTISKWLRIAKQPILIRAVEDGRVELGKAMVLAQLKDEVALTRALTTVAGTTKVELEQLVKAAAKAQPWTVDDGRLADVERKLSLVKRPGAAGLERLQRIHARVAELLLAGYREAAIAGSATGDDAAVDPGLAQVANMPYGPRVEIDGEVVKEGGQAIPEGEATVAPVGKMIENINGKVEVKEQIAPSRPAMRRR